MANLTSEYSTVEEILNSITHGVGILLAIGGLAVIASFASIYGDAWHIVSCSIFGAALVLSYSASTLYHAIPLPSAKQVLRILDHCAILILIAGTYTPFTLVSLRGPWGWSLFALIWGLAIFGIILEATPLRRMRALLLGLYLAMGWSVLVALKPLLASLPLSGFRLLLAGGLAYTGGVIFYLWRRLPYNHAIWHLFVLAGSIFHFFAVLLYVIPVVET